MSARSPLRIEQAQFEQVVAELDINMVVLSSPRDVAGDFVLPVINAGIKGVLNFTSRPLNFPRGIVVENYDITTLLEKVAYFVKVGGGPEDPDML